MLKTSSYICTLSNRNWHKKQEYIETNKYKIKINTQNIRKNAQEKNDKNNKISKFTIKLNFSQSIFFSHSQININKTETEAPTIILKNKILFIFKFTKKHLFPHKQKMYLNPQENTI